MVKKPKIPTKAKRAVRLASGIFFDACEIGRLLAEIEREHGEEEAQKVAGRVSECLDVLCDTDVDTFIGYAWGTAEDLLDGK